MKRGFGLMEVMVAAVVFAFLFIGLNILQKGNRESVLRIRARDAANVIAQDIIDSISAMGSASAPAGGKWSCPDEPSLCRTRIFTGSVTRLLKDTTNVTVDYSATVGIEPEEPDQIVNDETDYMKAGSSGISVKRLIAKHVDVTVNWEFKKTNQSINVSALVK